METRNQNLTLVTGGTGKTGSRIIEKLTAIHSPVSIGSRNANPPFDWYKPDTWKAALQHVKNVYIAFQPDLAIPEAAEIIKAFTKIAIENGVNKFVLLSGRGEEEAKNSEQVIIESGANWTILRSSWFMQNFSEGFFIDPIQTGYVALPLGNIREPFIDVNDIAEIAVGALTTDVHNGKLYELTGPQLLTFQEAITQIGHASNRNIAYQQVSMEDYVSMLKNFNVPREYINLIYYLFTEVLDGRNEKLTDGVQQALGRKPNDFLNYAKSTADTGIWSIKQN